MGQWQSRYARAAGSFCLALASIAVAALIVACGPPAIPGAPVGAPQVVCQGVPRDACRQAFDAVDPTRGQAGGGQGAIRRVEIRCTQAACTDINGEAVITIFYVSGGDETSTFGWSSAPAVPAAPS